MSNDGIAAGLKYWLVFLLAFFFLGYPVVVSIIFSALGGLAGGFISVYWKSKDMPIAPAAEPEVRETLIGRAKRRLGGGLERFTALQQRFGGLLRRDSASRRKFGSSRRSRR